MTITTRKIAALLSATALVGGAGIGVADAAKSGSKTRSAQNGRPGGKRGGPIPAATVAKIAETLGVSTEQLKSALDANRPAKPSGDRRPGPRQFAADIARELGVETSAVHRILEANRPERPAQRPAPGTPPDHTKLVSALASGLNLDEATVRAAIDKLDAAHRAEHDARCEAMYAAVAKSLGKTTEEVKAAFEANRPAPPSGT